MMSSDNCRGTHKAERRNTTLRVTTTQGRGGARRWRWWPLRGEEEHDTESDDHTRERRSTTLRVMTTQGSGGARCWRWWPHQGEEVLRVMSTHNRGGATMLGVTTMHMRGGATMLRVAARRWRLMMTRQNRWRTGRETWERHRLIRTASPTVTSRRAKHGDVSQPWLLHECFHLIRMFRILRVSLSNGHTTQTLNLPEILLMDMVAIGLDRSFENMYRFTNIHGLSVIIL